MNVGGDPGRDDYGLPPVDVEIPDDARELDRDTQAYYRELRALRRRALARRLYRPLSRDGMVLPLLAGCLALTLIAGTLLTVFTAGPGTTGASAPPAPAAPRLAPGRAGGPLPDAVVTVDGQLEPLSSLAGPVLVLALIPPGCRCLADVRQLTAQAMNAGAQPYLVGTAVVPLVALSRQTGMGPAHAVADTENALPPSYRPATLTAVVVGRDGLVARIVPDLGHGFRLQETLRALLPPASLPASPPRLAPSGTSTAAGPAAGGQ